MSSIWNIKDSTWPEIFQPFLFLLQAILSSSCSIFGKWVMFQVKDLSGRFWRLEMLEFQAKKQTAEWTCGYLRREMDRQCFRGSQPENSLSISFFRFCWVLLSSEEWSLTWKMKSVPFSRDVLWSWHYPISAPITFHQRKGGSLPSIPKLVGMGFWTLTYN